MNDRFFTKPRTLVGAFAVIVFAIVAGALLFFSYELSPADARSATQVVFEIKQGEGFRTVASGLASDGLIRTSTVFEIFARFGGNARVVKPGLYRLSASMTSEEILNAISGDGSGQVTVTIPEGVNIYTIDNLLSTALVIHPGDLIALQASGTDGNLEGRMFPDTYEFYTDANVKDVVKEFFDNFNTKAQPLLSADGQNAARDLVMASILEKEVPDQGDQEIVAGILLKRLAAGMPLDVDATVCYARLLAASATSTGNCPSLTALDFKIKSPYNTYLYRGLPPGPIGNPGVSAITAALHPENSPYWYYLSDPKTGKTIFAKTLDEQTKNRVKYLEGV